MSGDEVLVTLASAVVGPAAWLVWLVRLSLVRHLRSRAASAGTHALILALLGLLTWVVLRLCAADDVRNATEYLFMYSCLGLAWLRVATWFLPLAGFSPRDDLIERGNPAALAAWVGLLTGLTFAYAGGNIGDGPGWWVVVFSAVLASAGLAAVWMVIGQGGRLVEAVTIDRDPAAGLRLGGLMTAAGLLFGTAVTGDWVSAQATVVDFGARAWPIVPLMLLALGLERVLHPRPERPHAPFVVGGIGPAVAYVVIAAAFILLAERPPS